MHKYLMTIYHYFSGNEEFTIIAENKSDAVEKARKYVAKNPKYWGGNYDTNDIKCIKKLKADDKDILNSLRNSLIKEYGSSMMEMIDRYVEGSISDHDVAQAISSSGMDIVKQYKRMILITN